MAAVGKAVADNQYLIEGKDLVLDLVIWNDTVFPVKEEILYIAVSNLIRNAFNFTAKGSVPIVSEKESLSITDTGMGIEAQCLDTMTQTHIKGDASQDSGLGHVPALAVRLGIQLRFPGPVTGPRLRFGGVVLGQLSEHRGCQGDLGTLVKTGCHTNFSSQPFQPF